MTWITEELDLELNIKKRDKDYNSVIFNLSFGYVRGRDGQDTFWKSHKNVGLPVPG